MSASRQRGERTIAEDLRSALKLSKFEPISPEMLARWEAWRDEWTLDLDAAPAEAVQAYRDALDEIYPEIIALLGPVPSRPDIGELEQRAYQIASDMPGVSFTGPFTWWWDLPEEIEDAVAEALPPKDAARFLKWLSDKYGYETYNFRASVLQTFRLAQRGYVYVVHRELFTWDTRSIKGLYVKPEAPPPPEIPSLFPWGLRPYMPDEEIPEPVTTPRERPDLEYGDEKAAAIQAADTSKRPPTASPMLYEGRALELTWTHKYMATGLSSVLLPTEWGPYKRGAFHVDLAYRDSLKRKGREYAIYLGEAPPFESKTDNTPQPLERDVSLEILQKFGIIHARLFVGLGIATRKHAGTKGRARLTQDDLLRIAGLKDESHLTRAAQLEMIHRALNHLRSLCIWVTPGPKEKKQIWQGGGPLYYVGLLPTIEQPLPFDAADGALPLKAHLLDLKAEVLPGPWLYDMLELGPYQEGYVPQGVLEISPKWYPIASRVGLFCALNWWRLRHTKVQGKKRKTDKETVDRSIPIGEILRAVIPEQEPEEEWEHIGYTWAQLRRDKHMRQRVMNQVQELPQILEERGIRLEVDFPDRDTRRSWDDFLQIELRWQLVGGIEIEKVDRRAAPPDLPPPGPEIARRMDELGWSGKDLAREIGVSPTMVSFWRSGSRRVSEAHLPALKRLLDLA